MTELEAHHTHDPILANNYWSQQVILECPAGEHESYMYFSHKNTLYSRTQVDALILPVADLFILSGLEVAPSASEVLQMPGAEFVFSVTVTNSHPEGYDIVQSLPDQPNFSFKVISACRHNLLHELRLHTANQLR